MFLSRWFTYRSTFTVITCWKRTFGTLSKVTCKSWRKRNIPCLACPWIHLKSAVFPYWSMLWSSFVRMDEQSCYCWDSIVHRRKSLLQCWTYKSYRQDRVRLTLDNNIQMLQSFAHLLDVCHKNDSQLQNA
jgi:hypothetical protein